STSIRQDVFFFQAEDGIRDRNVTGVQTCALPIYVEIDGVAYQPGLIKARAIYSEMKRTGTFETSNAKVQRLYENQLWGQKSNYVELPTDCPQRDERQGYTGDGQVAARTGPYNYERHAFWPHF